VLTPRRAALAARLAFFPPCVCLGLGPVRGLRISIQLKVFDGRGLEAKRPKPRCCERIYRLLSAVSLKSGTICALREYHDLLDRGKGHRACPKHGYN